MTKRERSLPRARLVWTGHGAGVYLPDMKEPELVLPIGSVFGVSISDADMRTPKTDEERDACESLLSLLVRYHGDFRIVKRVDKRSGRQPWLGSIEDSGSNKEA